MGALHSIIAHSTFHLLTLIVALCMPYHDVSNISSKGHPLFASIVFIVIFTSQSYRAHHVELYYARYIYQIMHYSTIKY
mgnify:CR=1 FL=1